MPQQFCAAISFCVATVFVPQHFLCCNSLTRCDDSCTATSVCAATFPCTVTIRKVRNNFAHTCNNSSLHFFLTGALSKMVANNDRIQPKIRRIQHNWPEVDEATLVSDFGAEAAGALRFLDTLCKASLSLQYRAVVQGATAAKNVRSPSSSTPFKAKDVQSVINSNPSSVHIGRSNVSCPRICNISLPFIANAAYTQTLRAPGQTPQQPVHTSRASTHDPSNDMSDSDEVAETSPPAGPIDPSASHSTSVPRTLTNINSYSTNL